MANISPIFDAGVGAYSRSALIAARASVRTRCARRERSITKLLVSATTRWSVEFRCWNVSPDCHSSAIRPLNRNQPSGASPPAEKAWVIRRNTPLRSEMAPAGELASVRMSGSVTSSTLSQPPASRVPVSVAAPSHRRIRDGVERVMEFPI